MKFIIIIILITPLLVGAQWLKANTPFLTYEKVSPVKEIHSCNGNLFAMVYTNSNPIIYISSNMGMDWSPINLPSNDYIYKFFTSDKTLFITYIDKFYRSTNNGTSWELIDNSFLLIKNSSMTAWIECAIYNSDYVLIGTDIGMFRSIDDGITWTSSSEGLPPSINYSDQNAKTRVSHINFNNKNIFISTDNGMFISTDNGNSWNALVTSGLPSNKSIDAIVSIGDELLVLLGALAIYSSTNSGQYWTKTCDNFTSSNDQNSPTFINNILVKDTLLFAGDMYSVYRSQNKGKDWVKIYTMESKKSFSDLIIQGKNLIIAGQYGIRISSDDGNSWNEANNGLSAQFNRKISFIDAYGSVLYVNCYSDEFLSTDNGASWVSGRINTSNLNLYALHGEDFFKISHNFFLKSEKRGWESISGPSSDPIFPPQGGAILERETFDIIKADTFAIVATNKGICRAGINNEVLLKHNSDWADWDMIFTKYCTYSLCNSGRRIIAGTANGIYYSDDLGDTWVYAGLIGTPVLALFPLNNNIIACVNSNSYYKFFRSQDNGTNWNYINIGLDSICGVAACNNTLYSITPPPNLLGYILWQRSLEEIMTNINKSEYIPNSFLLLQNYPNPFNPTTTITYSIPQACFVNITIYDLLGREILKLVNEEKAAGNYEVEFKGTNLPSGVYFYNLSTGSNSITKKMLLMK